MVPDEVAINPAAVVVRRTQAPAPDQGRHEGKQLHAKSRRQEAQVAGALHTGDGGDAESPSEVYLIPSRASDVDDIFEALCTGAELNPDVGGDDGDDANGGGMWFSGAQGTVGEEGAPMDEAAMMEQLAAFDRLLVSGPAVVDGQFDDAE